MYSQEEIEKKQITQRVAFYLRVSSDDQVEKYGLDLQKKSLEALLAYKGSYSNGRPRMIMATTPDDKPLIYEDDGVSGTFDLYDRPGFARMMEDLENSRDGKRPFDVVAVYKIDRLARKLEILLKAIHFFEKYEIQFVSTQENIDTTTAFGRAILGIMGVIAELELDTITQRMTRGREVAVLEGKVMGSRVAYGYTKDDEGRHAIVEEEAEVVKKIFFDFCHQGYTPDQIAARLTKLGIISPLAATAARKKSRITPSKKNASEHWRRETVIGILSNEVYLGKYYYNKYGKNEAGKSVSLPKEKWKLSEYRHQPIIDKNTFDMAQKRLQDRHFKREHDQKKAGSHVYLLAGLLKCDHCKENGHRYAMNGTKKEIGKGSGHYTYTYVCGRKYRSKHSTKCGVVGIPAEQLEKYVIELVKQVLADPEHAYKQQLKRRGAQADSRLAKVLEKQMETLRGKINAVPQMEERLREQHTHGFIDVKSLSKKMNDLKKQKAEWEQTLDELMMEKQASELPAQYIRAFDEYKRFYAADLEAILADRKRTKDLIGDLISEIIVFAREKRADEKLAGKKTTEKQYIPNEIKIVMRMPREMIMSLLKNERFHDQFLMESADWWVSRGSNPGHSA